MYKIFPNNSNREIFYFLFIGMLLLFCGYSTVKINNRSPNSYKSVKIGDQVWMTENLNVSKFRNGDLIPEAKTNGEWMKSGDERKPAWCYYDNDPASSKKFGKLYNWYAVTDKRGLAPKGWHVPNIEELRILKATVKDDGHALKAIGQGIGREAGTNTSGFSAFAVGCRGVDTFFGKDVFAYFWSSSEYIGAGSYCMCLNYNVNGISLDSTSPFFGCSVRCVKN